MTIWQCDLDIVGSASPAGRRRVVVADALMAPASAKRLVGDLTSPDAADHIRSALIRGGKHLVDFADADPADRADIARYNWLCYN